MADDTSTLSRFRTGFKRDGRVHLNNAGIAPMCVPAIEAGQWAASAMAEGTFGIEGLIRAHDAARASFAKLVGTEPDLVSMMQTCAAAISQVALGLPLAKGAEVVTWEQEYPSNVYPWLRATEAVSGRLVRVPSSGDWALCVDDLIAAMTSKTQVVAISWVQFQTGATTDLCRVAEACQRVGALLVVDGIQGLGVMPFDMEALGVDVVCGGTHKWLCGPVGHGFLAFRDGVRDQITPLCHGAMTYGMPEDRPEAERLPREDPRRFEPGTPLVFGALAGAAGIDWILEAGIEVIYGEASRLATRLREEIRRAGGCLIGCATGEGGSPITTFAPSGDLDVVAQKMRAEGISFSLRAGGFRLAPHAFNTDEDIDVVVGCLRG